MSTTEVVPTDSSTASQEINKGILDIKNLVTCKICTRLMYEPYTTKCGHTFCYGCLSKWLGHGQRKRQCPDCRTRINDEPSPNYTIRGIVHVLISNSAFLDDDDTPESLKAEQLQEASYLENDRLGPGGPGLFGGLFKVTFHDPIRDAADGIMRCPHCNWEVQDDYCEQCDLDFVDHFWADWSDDEDYNGEFPGMHEDDDSTLDGYDMGSEGSEEPNEEDEAFIDDGDIGTDDERIELGVFEDEDVLDTETAPLDVLDDGSSEEDGLVDNSDTRRLLQIIRDARTGSENSTIGTSESGTAESNGDSETSSESGDSEDGSEDDSEGDDEDVSEDDSEDDASSDSDDEPILQHRGGRRLGNTPSQRPASNQRFQGRRQHSNVIDLTTLPSPNLSHPRQQSSILSATEVGNIRPAAVSSSRTGTFRGEQDLDDGSGTDASLPVRPRKRERIVLSDSDGDDDPVNVQRDSRTQRRRLNRQSVTHTISGRGHQRALIGSRSSGLVIGTLPPKH